MKLLKDDYIKILDFYKINYSKYNSKTIKRKAEEILGNKLCRCIKRVKTKKDIDESRAIGICKKNVLNRKNLSAGRFSCKKGSKFFSDKNKKYTLKKIRK